MGAGRNIAHRPAWPSVALTALVALSGCGLTAVEDARDAATARPAVPDPGYVTVRRVDRPYVGLKPVEEDRRGTLPERFLGDDAVTLPLADARDEAVIATRIEAATGLAVRFVGAARADAPTAFAAPDGLSPNGGIWTGPLDRLLDSWTEAAGHDWRYDAETGRIEIVRTLTAVFRVNALAGAERHGPSRCPSETGARWPCVSRRTARSSRHRKTATGSAGAGGGRAAICMSRWTGYRRRARIPGAPWRRGSRGSSGLTRTVSPPTARRSERTMKTPVRRLGPLVVLLPAVLATVSVAAIEPETLPQPLTELAETVAEAAESAGRETGRPQDAPVGHAGVSGIAGAEAGPPRSRLLRVLSEAPAPTPSQGPLAAVTVDPAAGASGDPDDRVVFGCPRALLTALLAGAVETGDAVSALAIERETLALCRERQEIVTGIVTLSNTLDAGFCTDALEEALARHGKPEIFNTDQGSQFTSFAFTGRLQAPGIRISMDGRGRCMDNIFIERLWRSLKYEAIYLHEIADGYAARRLIRDWVRFYNLERPHLALDGRTPAEAYRGEPPVDMMDKPLRALPTSPQAQQQQQEDRMKGILAA